MAYFRLFRFPNLLIVALTQYLLYYKVIVSALRQGGVSPVFDHGHFFLLVLDTLIITACGYLANDLADLGTDRMNRPEKQLVGRRFSIAAVNRWLAALAGTGFFLAAYLAFYVENLPLLVLYPLALGGLMAYNLWLKRLPLSGNILVALYCAGAAGVLFLAEGPALDHLKQVSPGQYRSVIALLGWYSGFAFLSTLCRELVKDLEDEAGDREAGYRTAPIVWGMAFTRKISLATGLLLGLFLLAHGWHFRALIPEPALVYILLTLFLPLLLILGRLNVAQEPRDYHRISQGLKVFMLGGLFLLLWL